MPVDAPSSSLDHFELSFLNHHFHQLAKSLVVLNFYENILRLVKSTPQWFFHNTKYENVSNIFLRTDNETTIHRRKNSEMYVPLHKLVFAAIHLMNGISIKTDVKDLCES